MVESTLTIGKISEGFVLDHIQAGKSMDMMPAKLPKMPHTRAAAWLAKRRDKPCWRA